MSIRADKWRLYAGPYVSGSGASNVYKMVEGKTPAEQGLSDSTYWNVYASSTYTTVLTYQLPVPVDAKVVAGTYEVVLWLGGYGSGCVCQCQLNANGGSTLISGNEVAVPQYFAVGEAVTCTVTVANDILAITSLALVVRLKGNQSCNIWPVKADVRFGAQAASAGCPRTTPAVVPVSPLPGSHAAPTRIASSTPTWVCDLDQGAYPDDAVTLVKYTDTPASAAHNASGASTQTVGTVSAKTDSWPTTTTRRVSFTADATRKADIRNNTYYVLTIKDADGGALATVPYELLLGAVDPQLASLSGTSAAPLMSDDVAPYCRWVDANSDTTHHRVRVYRAADDALMWDSTETVAGATQVQIPTAAGLASLTTYYVVVTIMNGAGGSNWSIDSARGYFQIDQTATGVEITSHKGTAGAPTLTSTLTPTIAWSYGRAQQALNLTVVDEADDSVAYASGWTASTDKEHTIP